MSANCSGTARRREIAPPGGLAPAPRATAGTAELFRAAYGPTVRTFEALDEDGRASFAAALREHWTRANRPGSTSTEVESEYLEVVAVRL